MLSTRARLIVFVLNSLACRFINALLPPFSMLWELSVSRITSGLNLRTKETVDRLKSSIGAMKSVIARSAVRHKVLPLLMAGRTVVQNTATKAEISKLMTKTSIRYQF